MFEIEFELNGLPVRTNNARSHWALRSAEARKWKRKVIEAVIYKKLKPKKPLKHAILTLTRHSSVEPDFDGLVSSFKHVIDGLIYAQVLENDKTSNIGQPTYIWRKAPPGRGYIRVSVKESESINLNGE